MSSYNKLEETGSNKYNGRKYFAGISRPNCVLVHYLVLYCLVVGLAVTCVILASNGQHQINFSLLHNSNSHDSHLGKVRKDLELVWPNTVCFPCTDLSANVTWKSTDTLFSINATCTPQLCCLKEVGSLRKLIYLMLNAHYKSLDEKNSDIFPDENDATVKQAKTKNTEHIPQVGAVAGTLGKPENVTKSTTVNRADTLKYWETRVDAAHLFINSSQCVNSTGGKVPWTSSNKYQTAMLSSRIQYNASSRVLKVEDSGMYFVYSAITFKPLEATSQVYHLLSRRHHLLPKTGEELLMINKYGGERQSPGFYTSFLCGTLRLRQDDQLSIQVSNHTYIYNYYYSNYFGIYKL